MHHPEHPTSPHEHGHSIYEPGEFLDAPASEPIPEREVSLARRFLNVRTIGSIVFGVALLVLLFVFVLGVDWGKTWSQIAHANVGLLLLALGASGEVILVGRGAGWLLPRASTLHVRVVAPLQDRVAYMSQWLRLTAQEAAEQVRGRDRRREDFVAAHFHGKPSDIHQYDLLLNSSLLGEDVCADLIAQAARAKLAALQNA